MSSVKIAQKTAMEGKKSSGKRKKEEIEKEQIFEEEDWLENVEIEDSDEDDSDYEEGESASDGWDEGSEEEIGSLDDSDGEEDSGKDEGEEGGSDDDADGDAESSDEGSEEVPDIDEDELKRTIMAKIDKEIKLADEKKSKSLSKSKPGNKAKDKLTSKGKDTSASKEDLAKEQTTKGEDTVGSEEQTTEGKEPSSSSEQTEDIVSVTKAINEYEFDSSDEEDIRNTVGNIPMEWYENYEHIGYDVKGVKIAKPPTRDELDSFLNKVDNPDYWRTVFDKKNGEEIVLSLEDVASIQKIQEGHYTGSDDPYEPWVDFFSYDKMIHPVTRRPEHKRSFIPSLLEKKKVSHYVHALKMGWIKPLAETYKKKEEGPQFYDIWGNTENQEMTKRQRAHIAAPKMKLPGHEESYNPPPEYLPTQEEIQDWNEAHPEDRKTEFLPRKFDCLRKVPAYENFMLERFERCLDLYLCPRQRRLRVKVQPEDLLPQLPKPKDLQPFPTVQAIVYQGHKSYVRSISVDPSGQWLLSGSDDKTVKFWEISTGRCLKTVTFSNPVLSVSWCPNQAVCLAAAAVGNKIHIINPGLGDKLVVSSTEKLLEEEEKEEDEDEKPKNPLVEWMQAEEDLEDQGVGLTIKHFKDLKQVTWHGRGDYFAVVIQDGGHSSVMIHQLSKRRSQTPFKKTKGLVQCVAFHPIRPFFFVATQRYVRVYNLLKQELTKKLLTNAKWVSSISIHPGGDNVLVGTYDTKLSWFDMDLSTKPYKTLRNHKQAVRHVCYHKRYPLFASASDDGCVIIFHGQVYNDLLQNPLIVPVKILRGHSITTSLGVLACEFHPSQPWIFTSGADSTIRLYT